MDADIHTSFCRTRGTHSLVTHLITCTRSSHSDQIALLWEGVPGEPSVPYWGSIISSGDEEPLGLGAKGSPGQSRVWGAGCRGLERNETRESSQPRERATQGKTMAQGECPGEEQNMELSPWPSEVLTRKLAVCAGDVHAQGCVRYKSQRWGGWVGVEGLLA